MTSTSTHGDMAEFQVSLDMQQFRPEDIRVKTAGSYIVIEGDHQEKDEREGGGFIERHFVRKYLLPEGVKAEGIKCELSTDGVLSIHAPKAIGAPQTLKHGKDVPLKTLEKPLLQERAMVHGEDQPLQQGQLPKPEVGEVQTQTETSLPIQRPPPVVGGSFEAKLPPGTIESMISQQQQQQQQQQPQTHHMGARHGMSGEERVPHFMSSGAGHGHGHHGHHVSKGEHHVSFPEQKLHHVPLGEHHTRLRQERHVGTSEQGQEAPWPMPKHHVPLPEEKGHVEASSEQGRQWPLPKHHVSVGEHHVGGSEQAHVSSGEQLPLGGVEVPLAEHHVARAEQLLERAEHHLAKAEGLVPMDQLAGIEPIQLHFPGSQSHMAQSEVLNVKSDAPVARVQMEKAEIRLPQPEIHLAQPEIHLGQPEIHLGQPEIVMGQPVINLPQPEIIMPQPEIHLPQAEIVMPQPQINLPQPKIQLAKAEIHLPQPEIVVPAPQINLPQPKIHLDQPQIHLPQPQIHVPQPKIQMPQAKIQVPQPQIHMPQPQITVPQPEINLPQPEIHIPQPEIHVRQPEIHVPQPEIHIPEPEIHIPEPQIHVPEPEIHVPEPEIHVPQPEIHVPEPQIHVPEPEIHVPEPEIHVPQPEILVPEPEIHVREPEVRVAEAGVHASRPEMGGVEGLKEHKVSPTKQPTSELEEKMARIGLGSPQGGLRHVRPGFLGEEKKSREEDQPMTELQEKMASLGHKPTEERVEPSHPGAVGSELLHRVKRDFEDQSSSPSEIPSEGSELASLLPSATAETKRSEPGKETVQERLAPIGSEEYQPKEVGMSSLSEDLDRQAHKDHLIHQRDIENYKRDMEEGKSVKETLKDTFGTPSEWKEGLKETVGTPHDWKEGIKETFGVGKGSDDDRPLGEKLLGSGRQVQSTGVRPGAMPLGESEVGSALEPMDVSEEGVTGGMNEPSEIPTSGGIGHQEIQQPSSQLGSSEGTDVVQNRAPMSGLSVSPSASSAAQTQQFVPTGVPSEESRIGQHDLRQPGKPDVGRGITAQMEQGGGRQDPSAGEVGETRKQAILGERSM